MKIAIITEKFWPNGSGGELATYLISKILSKCYEVTIITGTKNFLRIPNTKMVYVPWLGAESKAILWNNIYRHRDKLLRLIKNANIVYIPRYAFPIIPILRNRLIDVKIIVHFHSYILISYVAAVLAPYEQYKDKTQQNDIQLECNKDLKHCVGAFVFSWLPKLVRKWVLQADKFICVSRRQAQIISDAVPEIKDKIEVLYNPIPQFYYSNEKQVYKNKTLLYLGGDNILKGFYHVLYIALKLVEHEKYIKLYITNTIRERNLALISRINKILGRNIIIPIGRVPYNQLRVLYQKAWALLFPSIWEEPLPYVPIESIMHNTPPIATNVGGVSEIINDQRFLSKPDNINEFINKLENVLTYSTEQLINVTYKLKEQLMRKVNNHIVENKLIKIFENTYVN